MAFVRLLPCASFKSHSIDTKFHWNILSTVYRLFFLAILGSAPLQNDQLVTVIPIARFQDLCGDGMPHILATKVKVRSLDLSPL